MTQQIYMLSSAGNCVHGSAKDPAALPKTHDGTTVSRNIYGNDEQLALHQKFVGTIQRGLDISGGPLRMGTFYEIEGISRSGTDNQLYAKARSIHPMDHGSGKMGWVAKKRR